MLPRTPPCLDEFGHRERLVNPKKDNPFIRPQRQAVLLLTRLLRLAQTRKHLLFFNNLIEVFSKKEV